MAKLNPKPVASPILKHFTFFLPSFSPASSPKFSSPWLQSTVLIPTERAQDQNFPNLRILWPRIRRPRAPRIQPHPGPLMHPAPIQPLARARPPTARSPDAQARRALARSTGPPHGRPPAVPSPEAPACRALVLSLRPRPKRRPAVRSPHAQARRGVLLRRAGLPRTLPSRQLAACFCCPTACCSTRPRLLLRLLRH